MAYRPTGFSLFGLFFSLVNCVRIAANGVAKKASVAKCKQLFRCLLRGAGETCNPSVVIVCCHGRVASHYKGTRVKRRISEMVWMA
jgi:hypothetical protein